MNKYILPLLLLLHLVNEQEAVAQQNATSVQLSDTVYAMISPSMREIEVENIEPDGWFFAPRRDSTDVFLIAGNEQIALGPITSVVWANDTLSIYQLIHEADTLRFPLSNDVYLLKERGALYHKEIGRLGAIGLRSAEEKMWLVFRNSLSVNSKPILREVLTTTEIHWKQEGSLNLPAVSAQAIDTVDNNPEGAYVLSVVGPWPWRRSYGSIPLIPDELFVDGVKMAVYRPEDRRHGREFTQDKKGYLFGDIRFRRVLISGDGGTVILGKMKFRRHKGNTKH